MKKQTDCLQNEFNVQFANLLSFYRRFYCLLKIAKIMPEILKVLKIALILKFKTLQEISELDKRI